MSETPFLILICRAEGIHDGLRYTSQEAFGTLALREEIAGHEYAAYTEGAVLHRYKRATQGNEPDRIYWLFDPEPEEIPWT